MKQQLLRLGVALFLSLPMRGQESPYLVVRSRLVDMSVESAWKNCVDLVRSAPTIVNTLDPSSHLVSFTMPLAAMDTKDFVLDAKDMEKQPLTLHVTIWISTVDQRTRLYVRAAPNGGGFFAHSNGRIELQILDAIQQDKKWMPTTDGSAPQLALDAAPSQVETALLAVVSESKRLKLNAASSEPPLVTLSLMIPSNRLNEYISPPTKQEYPGVAHMTIWFVTSGSQTVLKTRTLIFESGNLSPVPLTSTGKLELAITTALLNKVKNNPDSTMDVGSNYRGKPVFWNSLFDLDAPDKDSESALPVNRDLPVPMETAWTAALQVITQTNLIVSANRNAGKLIFLSAHTSTIGTKYAVHRIELSFVSTEFGTRMTMSIPRAQETADQGNDDLKLYSERIATELFLKDRLQWLTKRQ